MTRAVLHGRSVSTGDVHETLRRAGLTVERVDVEAALVSAPQVRAMGPGWWVRV